jgi:predicted nuclease with TOPRIM domain
MKEKNVLAERLKTAETSRQKFDEEMKRFTSETVGKEELRKSLENEVRRLNSRMGQTETGLREKEEQVGGRLNLVTVLWC